MTTNEIVQPFGDEESDDRRRQRSDDGLRILMKLGRIMGAAKRHFQPMLSRHGLSGAEVWALWHICGAPGTSVGRLARQLSIRASTASNLVEQLCAKGLVSREKGGGDQRVVRLVATESGARAVEAAVRRDRAFSDLVQGLSDEQLHKLDHALELLLWQLPSDDDAPER